VTNVYLIVAGGGVIRYQFLSISAAIR